MICSKCGTSNSDNSRFCTGCGAPLTNGGDQVTNGYTQPVQDTGYGMYGTPVPGQNMRAPSSPVYNQPPVIPPEYQPISPWGYVGYHLLFAIPIAGLIIAIVFAAGSTTNINLKNLAISNLILIIIGIAIGVLLTVAGVGIGSSLFR